MGDSSLTKEFNILDIPYLPIAVILDTNTGCIQTLFGLFNFVPVNVDLVTLSHFSILL